VKEWKDFKFLDIDNLPERFFTRNDIEIEWYNDSLGNLEWQDGSKDKRYDIITYIMEVNVKYRYRIKPLESIRITQEVLNKLWEIDITSFSCVVGAPKNEGYNYNGRKVEIID